MEPKELVDLVKFFASLGVGGVLAGFMFYFYHKEMQKHLSIMIEVIRQNTAALTNLVVELRLLRAVGLERQNRREDDHALD